MSQFLAKVVGQVVFRKTCYDCMLLIIEDLRQGCLKLYTLASMSLSVMFPKAYK